MESKRHLSDWLSSYADLVEDSEPPRLFKVWAGIGTVCAALQRKCYMRWSLWDTIYPNMFIVICGPSGCRKGTALAPAKYFLRALGIPFAAESITREALIQALAETAATDIDPLTGVPHMHSSLTVFSDELTVFLGKNNWQLMSDLNDWFDCKDTWTYRTKHFGSDEVIGVWVNIIGATTPSFIQTALPQDAIGGGLSSRIVFVYGDKKSKVCAEQFFTEADEQLQGHLLHDLECINMLRGEFKRDESYMSLYREWYNRDGSKQKFKDPNFAGYNDRRALHLRKLSMVMSVSRSDEMVIRDEDFERAHRILEATEEMMAFTFSGRGRLPTASIIDKILRQLSYQGRLLASSLLSQYAKDITSKDLDDIIKTLERSGYAQVVLRSNGDKELVFIKPEKDKQ